ncbi:MAG TPA: cell division protein ZapE [Moraxellaceae bacterium]|nr:cell division protein ZapE [Moraxellaceae bacterium]
MPSERYQHDLRRSGFQHDEAQATAVRHLQRVKDDLTERYQQAKDGRGLGLLKLGRGAREPVRGLYMWGGVGRGKTYLMDLFFDALPFRRKLRIHFHRFMQRVHKELNSLRGTKNPLDIVADRLHEEAVVICFDEFFVTDITDAMLLGGLFEKLFARGVTLVATSNIPPDRLYEHGLQRERFLPAIALLKQHCEVLNVDAGVDYRLRVLEKASLYYTPNGPAAEAALQKCFDELTGGVAKGPGSIVVNEREIRVLDHGEDVLWATFSELCETARAATDYIEIAREYQTVIVSGIPVMDARSDNAVRRFINMVDEFYDRHVKLIVSADAGIDGLYEGGRLNFEIERTKSRLLEMQSREYLAREHLA